MTVLDSTQPFSQYTGTGQRVYFEYGFYWNGGPVVVYVNNLLVSFTYQANGVVLIEAPALNDVIIIRSKTDITQERNWVPFDEFRGEWTEAACDKLILLKQEALAGRMNTNLRAIQQLDRTIIDNSQGTNADVFLWNENQSGVFSGEVTTQMPAIGSVVAKPEDFAYFQHGGDPSEFSDYEICIMMDNDDAKMIYFGVDFTTGDDVDIASFRGQYGIATDGTLVYYTAYSAPNRVAALLHFRGHCFSYVDYDTMPGNTPHWQAAIRGYYPRFIAVGSEGTNHGFRVHRYNDSSQQLTTYFGVTDTSDFWAAALDLRHTDRDLPGYGDALVLTPKNGNSFATYFVDPLTDSFTPVDRQTASALEPGFGEGWGWNRNNGLVGVHFTSNPYVDIYEIDLDTLLISVIGRCNTTSVVRAVCFSNDGHVITLEEGAGALEKIRTYERSGTTLTPIDEWELPNAGVINTNQTCQIQISPFTNRFWCMTQNATLGTHAFVVDELGAIDVQYSTTKSINNAGSIGNPIIFVQGAMNITGNGFTGVKGKLYEAWDLDEASGTRFGAFGKRDFVAWNGTVGSRSVGGVTGADFNGASSLKIATTPTEYTSVGSMAQCIDVVLDTKTTSATFVSLCLSNQNATSERSWRIGYSKPDQRIFFAISVVPIGMSATQYIVFADDIGDPSTGVLYHVYAEYNLEELKIKIRVNNGATNETAIPRHRIPYQDTPGMGRASTDAGFANYLDGGLRRYFYFWEPLSLAEQTWMYNSGNTRAFSELP